MCLCSAVCVGWYFTTKYDINMIDFWEVCTLSRVNLANYPFEHFMSYV